MRTSNDDSMMSRGDTTNVYGVAFHELRDALSIDEPIQAVSIDRGEIRLLTSTETPIQVSEEEEQEAQALTDGGRQTTRTPPSVALAEQISHFEQMADQARARGDRQEAAKYAVHRDNLKRAYRAIAE